MLITGFICDGPSCNKFVYWAADNTLPIPDDAHRMIVTKAAYEEPGPNQSPTGQPRDRTFCSPKCLRKFYHENNYSEPRSPRELDAIRQANADAERKKNKEKNAATETTPVPSQAESVTVTAPLCEAEIQTQAAEVQQ